MFKKILLTVILLLPIECFALEIPELNSKFAIIYDLTSNEIIYEKDSNTKTSIASITKILTVMTALEKINDLNTEVEITSPMLENIPYYASVAGLKAGDLVTYKDLLYATLLPSGADAAEALALSLSASTTKFIEDMNLFAQNIGLLDSNFKTTTGLDIEGQYSTAKDCLILLKYALNNKIFKSIYTTKTYTLTNNLTVNSTLLWYQKKYKLPIERIIGSKTGNTEKAGTCLSSYLEVNNHEIIIITLNAPYSNETAHNLQDHLNLITYLDELYLDINDLTTFENNFIFVSAISSTFKSKESKSYIYIILILLILSFSLKYKANKNF